MPVLYSAWNGRRGSSSGSRATVVAALRLHPEYPARGNTVSRARSGRSAASLLNAIFRMFRPAGSPYAGPPTARRSANSRVALMLGELAREPGLFAALHRVCFYAYWARAASAPNGAGFEGDGPLGLAEGAMVDTLRRGYLDQWKTVYAKRLSKLGRRRRTAWLVASLPVAGAPPHRRFSSMCSSC